MFSGDALNQVSASVRAHADAGTAVRPAPAGRERIEAQSVTVADEGAVLVIYCVITDSVVFREASAEVVDDSVFSMRVTGALERSGDSWTQVGLSVLSRYDGEGCP